MNLPIRYCQQCGNEIDFTASKAKRFCSGACKMKHHRAQKSVAIPIEMRADERYYIPPKAKPESFFLMNSITLELDYIYYNLIRSCSLILEAFEDDRLYSKGKFEHFEPEVYYYEDPKEIINDDFSIMAFSKEEELKSFQMVQLKRQKSAFFFNLPFPARLRDLLAPYKAEIEKIDQMRIDIWTAVLAQGHATGTIQFEGDIQQSMYLRRLRSVYEDFWMQYQQKYLIEPQEAKGEIAKSWSLPPSMLYSIRNC